MRCAVVIIAAFIPAGLSVANPPTAPEHNEREYKAISASLYVRLDETPDKDDDGNLAVTVYSRSGLHLEARYAWGYEDATLQQLRLDAGSIGILRENQITIDCARRTYEVLDVRYAVPREVWRSAATLPALAPVFRFACK
jgi:hypothetical protein